MSQAPLGHPGRELVHARSTLVAAAAALIVGTLAFTSRAARFASRAEVRASSPIRSPGVLTLVLVTALADLALGGIAVLVPAFAEERGEPAVAGVLLAVFSCSSVLGALA